MVEGDIAGKIWVYAGFVVLVLLLLALDLGVFHRKAHVISVKEALGWSAFWIFLSLAFSGFIWVGYENHWFGLGLTRDLMTVSPQTIEGVGIVYNDAASGTRCCSQRPPRRSERAGSARERLRHSERFLDAPNILSIVTTGIRIYPGTELARRAVEKGVVSADDDLFEPRFDLSPFVDEPAILRRIDRLIAARSNVVHAAEDGNSVFQRIFHWTLHGLGVAPPLSPLSPALALDSAASELKTSSLRRGDRAFSCRKISITPSPGIESFSAAALPR